MCGIFGAIRTGSGRITVSSLKAMAKQAERRGPHAFGMAWIDANNRLHSFKSEGRITEALLLFDRMREAKAVIGHTRFATHGDASDNMNNHPHPCDGGWYVHNGQIPNYEDLMDQYSLLPFTACDSEVLGLMMQKFNGSLIRRVVKAVNKCDLTRPLNVMGLWNRPGRMVIVRRGNPLKWSKGRTGNLYFASIKEGLPGWAKTVRDDAVYQYDLTTGTLTEAKLIPGMAPKNARVIGSNWFGDDDDSSAVKPYHESDNFQEWEEARNDFDDDGKLAWEAELDREADALIARDTDRREGGMSATQRKALATLESRSGTVVKTKSENWSSRKAERALGKARKKKGGGTNLVRSSYNRNHILKGGI